MVKRYPHMRSSVDWWLPMVLCITPSILCLAGLLIGWSALFLVRFACWFCGGLRQIWTARGSQSKGGLSMGRSWIATGKPCLAWYYVVALFVVLRVGEASHPGPNDMTWACGIFNPSGLTTKIDYLAHIPGDVWLGSETHPKNLFSLFLNKLYLSLIQTK